MIDLTVSNPTRCGFRYDAEGVLGALQDGAAMTYDPAPCGILKARQAVSRYYAEHDASVDPDQLVLTTSTSEAYSFLFRLLCDPGDAVLAARPSYPLFDFVADLDDVRLEIHPLFYDFGWWIDFAELERRIGPRTRAILLVHPNNPTGHVTRRPEREMLEQLCVRHGLALIVDEVFLDYGIGAAVESFAAGPHPCLKFIVSGLSKIAALPQMKVGWVAAFGPEPDRAGALARLEIVADTFLSMNAPAQHALPVWLAGRETIAAQIRERVAENLQQLAGRETLHALPVEAGWNAVLRLPQRGSSASLAEELLRAVGVVVHPGSFYGLAGDHHVVVSLIGPTADFRSGVEKLKRWFEPEELTPRMFE